MIRVALVILCLFLSACQPPTVVPFQVVDYAQEAPIALAVSDIRVENKTVRYTELPHLESRMPMRPDTALTQALKNRFVAGKSNTSGQITFIVNTADMTQKTQEGDSWYILDNTEYLLSYQISVVYAHGDKALERQEITGWEKQALPKRSSLAEKEAAWRDMLNQMIQKAVQKIQDDTPQDLLM